LPTSSPWAAHRGAAAQRGDEAAAPPPASNAFSEAIGNIDWPGLAQSWTVRTLSLVIGVLLWQLACAYKFDLFIRFDNVPSPLVVAAALIKHAQETKFYVHILVSIKRILIGFALATFIGVNLGAVMGRSKIARDLVVPYIEILRPIPAVAWIPLAILMWPTEESSIIYIYVPWRAVPDRAQHRARRRADARGPGARRPVARRPAAAYLSGTS